MDSIKIKLNTDRQFKQPLAAGESCLVAQWSHTRPDGAFSGLSLSIQASPRIGEHHPDSVDSELFFQTLALVDAAPDLLAALTLARDTITTALKASAPDWFATDADVAGHVAIKKIDAAIAKATTHPLQDELEAAEIAYEESKEMARARSAERSDHDDDRDHLDDDNTDFGDDDRAYQVRAGDIDPETLQGAADAANEADAEERLLGGAA